MGLDIHGKVSKKDYHRSYSGLHLVRWLALVDCGMPKTIAGESSYVFMLHPSADAHKPGGRIINAEEMQKVLLAMQMSGFHYPNLLFHSDCEGTYTKRGKVMSDSEWMTGNSKGLLKELESLKESLENDKEKDTDLAWYTFDMLYNLVKDEVENGAGHLEFH